MRLLLGLLFISSVIVSATAIAEDLLPDERRVFKHNPLYGQALYALHSGDYQTAMGLYTKLRKQGSKGYGKVIDIHQAAAQLGLGMTTQARKQYQRILADKRINFIPSTARTQAWFYMAKHLYEKDLWGDALQTIRRVNVNYIDADLKNEYHFLNATLELFVGNPKAADQHIAAINIKSEWAVFAFLNLAISYTERDVHFSKVEATIEKALTLTENVENPKLLADKINLMAGQFFYATGRGRSAIKHLKNVGLDGPYTAKALLTYGWALTEQWQYHDALQPWYMLKTKYSPLNQDVQETLITIPHILEKLNAKVMALGAFEYASEQFDTIYNQLGESVERLKKGEFIEPLMQEQSLTGWGTFEKLNLFLPDHPDQAYLKDILGQGRVQSELIKLRDMYSMSQQVKQEKTTLLAFMQTVETRKNEYQVLKENNTLSKLNARHKALNAQYKALDEKIKKALGDKSGIDLATQSEQKNLQSITASKNHIVELADSKLLQTSNYQERLRRVNGLIKWNLAERYFKRSEKIKLAKTALKNEIDRLDDQLKASKYAMRVAPNSFNGFASRIQGLEAKLDKKLANINRLYEQQKQVFAQIVNEDIQSRQDRVRGYQLQARLASARLFDETSNKQRLVAEGGHE